MNAQINSRNSHQTGIRPVQAGDASAISRIYNYYIRETTVTFEEQETTPDLIQARINNVEAVDLPWLVAFEGEKVAGYAYATKWKERSAYRHSAEISVYVDHRMHGNGWGTKLYQALFVELQKRRIHLAIGGITLPNSASIALHEKFGMKKVAHFSEVGYKFGEWRDVGYWQKIL